MRKINLVLFVFIFLAAVNVCAQNIPSYNGYINDFAGVMSSYEKQEAEDIAEKVKEATGAEIAIVTIQSYESFGFGSIEECALEFFNTWGIGEKDKDNGVLLILSLTEREVRIEVGYGLEGIIPDSAAGRIIDNYMIPDFRDGNYGKGLVSGFNVIADRVLKNEVDDTPAKQKKNIEVYFLIAWIILCVFLASGIYRWPAFGIYLLICKIRRKTPKKFSEIKWNSSSGSGRSGGGGWSGGGGSSFGGGRSGGGGSSRRF